MLSLSIAAVQNRVRQPLISRVRTLYLPFRTAASTFPKSSSPFIVAGCDAV